MRRRKLSLSSTRLIRSFNAVSVLQTLYREGSSSRARLTKVTNMSPATITRIIAELIEQGVIIEERIGESNGGRRPIIFRLNYDKLYVAGIQILRDQITLVVCDIKGQITTKKVFQQYSLEPETLVAELANEFDLLLAMSKVDREHILGVGLAISGIVDGENGILIRSVSLGWRDIRIVELLEKALNLQVFVENDANAAALAEMWIGEAQDVSSLVYIKTTTGVGAGIIYEGNLLTGMEGMAGEIGHIPLIRGGRQCRCGQYGCLEPYLYLPDLVRRYENEANEQLGNENELFIKAADGHPIARMIVDEALEALGVTISFAEVMLDVGTVIIGGIWGEIYNQSGTIITEKLQDILERAGLNKSVTVKGSKLGEDADLLGAVGLVINQWFTPPI